MEPVTIALALAKATGLSDWLSDKVSDKLGNGTAKKIIDFATQVTGDVNGADALQTITNDPSKAAELKTLMLKNKHELDMAAYEDRKDARAIYKIHPAQADKLAERIMRYNLPYIALLLLVNCVAIYFFKDNGALLAAISNVMGMAIKSLFDERKEVSGFYFGGSMQSSPDNKD